MNKQFYKSMQLCVLSLFLLTRFEPLDGELSASFPSPHHPLFIAAMTKQYLHSSRTHWFREYAWSWPTLLVYWNRHIMVLHNHEPKFDEAVGGSYFSRWQSWISPGQSIVCRRGQNQPPCSWVKRRPLVFACPSSRIMTMGQIPILGSLTLTLHWVQHKGRSWQIYTVALLKQNLNVLFKINVLVFFYWLLGKNYENMLGQATIHLAGLACPAMRWAIFGIIP